MRQSAVTLAILCGVAGSHAQAAPVGGDAHFTRAADAAVMHITQADGFSGTIILARGDKILLRTNEGMADRAHHVVNDIDTPFPIESLTKQFTAAAILLLVQDGRLSLDDPAFRYSGQLPTAWMRITIRQLLNHSAGIVDCKACGDADFRDWHDYVTRSAETPLAFNPGDGMLYSNSGYGLLAAIIERASGLSYGEFIHKRILEPLGMRHTGFGALPADAAHGYIRDVTDHTWTDGSGARLEKMAGFNGLYSTVGDMLIWVRSLRTNAVLSPTSRTAMFSDGGHGYGFGWYFTEKFGRKLVWHTGADQKAGYASVLDDFPDEDLALIVLSNNTGLTHSTATLVIDGKPNTFTASAAREIVDALERLYFIGS